MSGLVLVVNSGSSSVKFQLFDMADRSAIATGLVERIGESTGRATLRETRIDGQSHATESHDPFASHADALAYVRQVVVRILDARSPQTLVGIGHRVVHGGDFFSGPAVVDATVAKHIRELIPLAPLHNGPNLLGIEEAGKVWRAVPQVAVFDTAFHQTLPPAAYRYAVPAAWYGQHRLRRYGFHGTSHGYVTKRAAESLQIPLENFNAITLHLGNGASAAAIRGGKCVDTSMGLTPLEGLVMGTRCGDIDPAAHFFLAREAGLSLTQLESLMNKESGLKGLCGVNDMRAVLEKRESGDENARLAIDVFVHRIKHYVGAYLAVLGRADALIFTAGVGEHAPLIRELACAGLEGLGIELNPEANHAKSSGLRDVATERSRTRVLVVPTNEELEIAEQTLACVQAR
ncbi:MAG TPA: acetate kinase [Pirellulales bacterium]